MSHGRLPWLRVDDLDEQQRALYDAITSSPRSASRRSPLFDELGRLHGPFNALLFNPALGDSVQGLGTSVRYGVSLSGRAREIAVLEVARSRQSNYQWLAHSSIGLAAGLSDEELDALAVGAPVSSFSSEEQIVRSVAQALVSSGDLSDDLYQQAVDLLGVTVVVELVILVGFYELIALVLQVSRTPLPEGFDETFPAT